MDSNNVIHLMPGRPVIFSDDQTAIKDAWRTHHGELRRLNTSRVVLFCATGLGILLAGLGVLTWALGPHPIHQTVVQAPPVTVNVPPQEPPQVTVNVPKLEPATVEPSKPQLATPLPAAMVTPANPGDGKTVVDFTVFHRKEVGRMNVVTGWGYKTVEDKSPQHQWCYIDALPNRPFISSVGKSRDLDGIKLAKQLGYSDAEIEQALAACQWFQGMNANIRDRVSTPR